MINIICGQNTSIHRHRTNILEHDIVLHTIKEARKLIEELKQVIAKGKNLDIHA